jgi:hypothetical protein
MAPASKADHDSVNIRSCRRLREGVGLVFQGISRTLGSAPDQKNAAITAEVRRWSRRYLPFLSSACGTGRCCWSASPLRSGLAPRWAMADVSERAITAQTGHKSLPMVRRHIRDGSLCRSNAAAVGL